MITSNDGEKAFGKIQHLFITNENLSNLEINENFLTLIKSICKLTTNITCMLKGTDAK